MMPHRLQLLLCRIHCDGESDEGVPYLLEVFVTVDVLLVVHVLEPVGLDILPEGLDDS